MPSKSHWRNLSPVFALIPLALYLFIIIASIFHTFGGHRIASSTNFFPTADARCTSWQNHPHSPRFSLKRPPLIVLHITDLHISALSSRIPSKNVKVFLTAILPRFAGIADVLAITGDLVNAKAYPPGILKHLFGYRSEQSALEWSVYSAYAAAARETLGPKTNWIIVPGNHDVFGTRHIFDAHTSTQSRFATLTTPSATFAVLDPTLDPPLHRPLNFFGNFSPPLAEPLATLSPDALITISHYPSAVLSSSRALDAASRPSSRQTTLHLSGHLHTMCGLFPRGMQAVSSSGRLELQLADLVDAAAFRVLTIDNGAAAWTDFHARRHAAAPLVVVMNVPRAGLCAPGAGLAALDAPSIRLLVVGSGIDGVRVFIDGSFVGRSVEGGERLAQGASVFVVPWDGRAYDDGRVHTLDVFVDEGGIPASESAMRHVFALDGRRAPGLRAWWEAVGGAFFVLSDFESIATYTVYFGLAACVAIGAAVFFFSNCREERVLGTAMVAASLWFGLGGPILVAVGLTDGSRLDFVSIRHTVVNGAFSRSGVDPYFALFKIVIGGMLPSFYWGVVFRWGSLLRKPALILCVRFASFLVLISWTLNVAGAHGIFAVFASPSCFPLCVLVWAILREPLEEEDKKKAYTTAKKAFRTRVKEL